MSKPPPKRIAFSKDETKAIVAAIQRYFDAELDQKIGDLPAELLLDFFADHVGAYFYNRGLYDAQAAFTARMEDVSDVLYALERKPGDGR
jgi:uncharacterized protein (DUF2164 family)